MRSRRTSRRCPRRCPPREIAAYVRRLFRSEVELGPLLERTVRGAHLPAYDVVLPPLPPALLGLPKLTVGMLGLPDNDGEQRALDLTSHIKIGPIERLSLVNPTLTVRDAELARAEPQPGFDDLTQSVERPLSAPPRVPPASPGDAAPEPPTVAGG